MLEKFKENFFSLNNILNGNDLLNFMIEKKAFDENFMKMICESNELTKLSNVKKNNTKNFEKKSYFFDITKIDNDYIVGYNCEKNKITLDISGNTIFSFYDNKKELKRKFNFYVDNEEYENANVIYNFIKKCEI